MAHFKFKTINLKKKSKKQKDKGKKRELTNRNFNTLLVNFRRIIFKTKNKSSNMNKLLCFFKIKLILLKTNSSPLKSTPATRPSNNLYYSLSFIAKRIPSIPESLISINSSTFNL